ncbi:MAG: hypothetical protein H7X91_08290 [Burkholderiales bacterium]|nr:hypothetical protein [Burkholderiales bacterium]
MLIRARVTNIIFAPQSEWQTIAGERSQSPWIDLLGYALPLAALGPLVYGMTIWLSGIEIGPAATPFPMDSALGAAVGAYVFDPNLPVGEDEVRVSLVTALWLTLVTFVASVLTISLFGLLLHLFALTMVRGSHLVDAFKVAVYASTPAWLVAGCLVHALMFVILVIGMLYSLYLCYLPPISASYAVGNTDSLSASYAIGTG